MTAGFLAHHKKEMLGFAVGVAMAVVFFAVPGLHRELGNVGQLGYPGMFVAGIMYGSGLTSSLAGIVFVESPPGLNLVAVSLLGGLGSALYDLFVFLTARRQSERGWLAAAIDRMRQRRHVPNWVTLLAGTIILVSPLPDELAAGLFGVNHVNAKYFFLYSFASNVLGVMILSGAF